jgi:hypothetical protein
MELQVVNMDRLHCTAFSATGSLVTVLLLNQGINGRTRVLRQTEWEDFVPLFWRPDLEDAPIPETTQTLPLTTDDGAMPPVVDGNGSLLGCVCPAPPQFNPVCGNDGVTYGNLQKLNCARSCGRSRFSFLCCFFSFPLFLYFLSRFLILFPSSFFRFVHSYIPFFLSPSLFMSAAFVFFFDAFILRGIPSFSVLLRPQES